jgi:hypothetical protein
MSSDKSKISLRDQLTATTDEGKIELNEQELGRVSGGIIIIGGGIAGKIMGFMSYNLAVGPTW